MEAFIISVILCYDCGVFVVERRLHMMVNVSGELSLATHQNPTRLT